MGSSLITLTFIMKKLQFLFIASLLLSFMACGSGETTSETSTETSTETAPETETSEVVEMDFSLTETGAAGFNLNDPLPTEGMHSGFSLYSETKMIDGEGDPYEETTWIASNEGPHAFHIKPAFDYKKGVETDKIGEILVFGEEFRNADGIGPGSSITDFTTAYPDYKCYYTFVSGSYWLETGANNVQFHLSADDYTQEVSYDSDMTEIDIANFKEGATIVEVRFWDVF